MQSQLGSCAPLNELLSSLSLFNYLARNLCKDKKSCSSLLQPFNKEAQEIQRVSSKETVYTVLSTPVLSTFLSIIWKHVILRTESA